MKNPKKRLKRETGPRGSREVWLQAAYETLISTGVDAVRVMPLAEMMGLSRTSFYWFFEDRENLLDALIDLWRQKNTGNLIKQSEGYADSVTEAILNVFDCWLNQELFDSRFEFAVRSWTQQSPEVAEEVRLADVARLQALTRMFERFGYEQLAADVRARTIYLTQIGYISMQTVEDLATRMKRIPTYIEIFTGAAPKEQDLQRFFSRHNYKTKQTVVSARKVAR